MKPEDVERMLVERTGAPSPEGLAERIVDEIPRGRSESPDNSRRTRWRLAAAAVLTVALTGTVAWELRTRRPAPELKLPSGASTAGRPNARCRPLAPAVSPGDPPQRVNSPGQGKTTRRNDREEQEVLQQTLEAAHPRLRTG